MALYLTLMRHAKSAWDDPDLDDHDRPLNKRGRRDAPRIGTWLASRAPLPDLILCSTARRTRETAMLARPLLGEGARLRHLKSIYLAEPQALLSLVHKTPDGVGHLMLIGHNPGLEQLAINLVGDGDPALHKSLTEKFPTAACACMSFDVERWADIAPGTGTLRAYMVPKRLAEG